MFPTRKVKHTFSRIVQPFRVGIDNRIVVIIVESKKGNQSLTNCKQHKIKISLNVPLVFSFIFEKKRFLGTL